MNGKISYIDQNLFFAPGCKHVFSNVKLGILTWGVYGIDSLLQPASSGQSMNCSFSHFRVGFTRESGRWPLDSYLADLSRGFLKRATGRNKSSWWHWFQSFKCPTFGATKKKTDFGPEDEFTSFGEWHLVGYIICVATTLPSVFITKILISYQKLSLLRIVYQFD